MRNNLTGVSQQLSTCHCDIVKMGNYSTVNDYRPPMCKSQDATNAFAILLQSTIVGMNSHIQGYDKFTAVEDDPGAFRSARWQRDFSSDLC